MPPGDVKQGGAWGMVPCWPTLGTPAAEADVRRAGALSAGHDQKSNDRFSTAG